MRRRHRMPFGAEFLENRETRFTLWATAAETVDLVLQDGTRPMLREKDGRRLSMILNLGYKPLTFDYEGPEIRGRLALSTHLDRDGEQD